MIRPWNPSADAEAPAVVEELIRRAEAAGASDLHLQMAGAAARVDLRLDGLLAPYAELAPPLAEHVCGRIKFLARLKTYQDSLPQDGRIDRAEAGAAGDIRVSTYPTVTGEKIVLRFFSRRAAPNLAGLGLPARADTEFLPATAAYKPQVSIANGQLLVRYEVAPGYYLYRSKLGFESATPGVTLGAPAFPVGEDHEDEYFGKQVIYRDTFAVAMPVSFDGPPRDFDV
ncbi:MAG TPA: ATPase, T2SS/T4P/T4SS family, partial [Candidatus Paceibacterota bacterium]|nr:ATPase, T2SS/T4P/T4SS family [Candidatus Paceibacterota bacterium]